MRIYAGIDEAGYGPMFGPLVISRAVFRLEDDIEMPPDLWRILGESVTRRGRDKARRIAVDDSKALHTPTAGVAKLERGVLAFAALAGHEAAALDELSRQIGHDDASRATTLPWYATEPVALPTGQTAGEGAIDRGRLRRTAESVGATCVDLRAAVIFEDRYNAMVEAMRSKARCAWTFVSQHLWAIWTEFGKAHPYVAVDRQGGRTDYRAPLQLLFEGATLRQIEADDRVARYTVQQGDRMMTLSFETESEQHHLPVALASMTAKYMREMWMDRFNAFWLTHNPELKPTKGYVQDGRRFLAEIEPLIAQLGFKRDHLIRSR